MANYYVLLTDYGKSFIANAQANSQLALTHVVLGDANDQPYLPESRLNQTSLVKQRAKQPIASVKIINDTTAEVTAVIPSNVGGFNVHEIGVTDSSGKLVYVGNFHGGYRPTLTEGAGGDMELIITIKADNLATVVIEAESQTVVATREWVTERFVTKPTFQKHLDDENPHDQYLLKTTHEQHATENDKQHKEFSNWQAKHVTVFDENNVELNPHPQYVPFSLFNARIAELMDMIKRLTTGQDSADVLLSRLKLALSTSTNPKTRVIDEQGFEFLGYSDLDAMGVRYRSSRNGALSKLSYTFIFDLPAEYDPELHTVYAIAGDGRLGILDADTRKVKFTISTTESSRFVNMGDDEYTEWSSGLSDSLTVEVYGKGEPVIPAGTVLGRIDTVFSGAQASYSKSNETVNVGFSRTINGDFNLVPIGKFETAPFGEVVCSFHESVLDTRLVELNYPDGWDANKHEVRSNVVDLTEKEDGTGVYFYLPYKVDSRHDDIDNYNEYKYSVSATYYFELVQK